jgi:apolipoprotein N-acyltransferase
VVAAWAVVVSETLMPLYMGSPDEENSHFQSGPLVSTANESNGHYHHLDSMAATTANYDRASNQVAKKYRTALLAAVLVLLTVPSYFTRTLPIPLGDVSKVTPLAVGCALPTVDEYKVPEFNFEHYLAETKRMDGTTNFILWPEGAVKFQNAAKRNEALDEVRKKVVHAFVGVSFEETLEDVENTKNRHGIKRTGIAIVSNKTDTIHLLYYKRHLVPSESHFDVHGLRSL